MTHFSARFLAIITAMALGNFALNAVAQNNEDVMAATGRGENANTGPLHTVTIITPDLAALRKLYETGLGLTVTGPHAVSDLHRDETLCFQEKSWNSGCCEPEISCCADVMRHGRIYEMRIS